MSNSLTFQPDAHEIGERLDKVMTNRLSMLSRAKIQQLIKDDHVQVTTVRGYTKIGKASYRLEEGDTINAMLVDAILTPDIAQNTEPEAIPLEVLYEDDDLAAINKPAGLVVHPAAGHGGGTLVNALLNRWPQVAQVGGEGRAGIVHRLDKDTSGVILIAKTEPTRLYLMNQFERRQVEKHYWALTEGQPNTPTGEINAPIARDVNQRKRMAIIQGGREAVTLFQVLKVYHDGFTLIEAMPKTGRTHQIRVHLAFIGCPIVGDPVYGRRKQRIKLGRQFLHAQSITLTLPSKHLLTVQAPLPADLQQVLDHLAE